MTDDQPDRPLCRRDLLRIGAVGAATAIVPEQGYDDYLFVLGLDDLSATDLRFEGFYFGRRHRAATNTGAGRRRPGIHAQRTV